VGERRLNFYITFTAGVGTIIIAAQEIVVPEMGIWLLVGGITLILSLGLITFRKMLQRRTALIIFRRRLARIRTWFVEYYPSVASGLPYDIGEEFPMDWGKNRLGSTAYSVAFINTALVILAVAAMSVTTFSVNALWWALPVAATSGATTWWLHLLWKIKWMQSAEDYDRERLLALDELKARAQNKNLYPRDI
jgi:hypothetical protein